MDPAFVSKLLDDDEVDNIHSGADVEAFTAALNRDISVDTTAPAVPHRANPPGTLGALTTDSNSTPSQLIEDWHASNERDHAAQKDIDPQEKHQEHEDSQPKQPNLQTEHANMASQQGNPSTGPHHLQKDQTLDNVPAPNFQQSSAHQWQQDKQKLNENQQPAPMSDQTSSHVKRVKSGSVPFTVLIPILRPHLDKDRNMQLDAVFAKLRSNEITKENFLRVIRNIVGDPMLRQAAQKVQSQMASRSSQSSSSQSESHSSQQQASVAPLQHLPPSSHLRTQKSTIQAPQSTTTSLTQTDTSTRTSIDSQQTLSGYPLNSVKQEREVSVVSVQAVNKQQQQQQQQQLSMYGATSTSLGSQMLPRPAGTPSLVARKTPIQDTQMRQLTPQGLLPIHQGSKHDVQSTVTEFNGHGPVSHFTGQLSSQQSHSQLSRQLSIGNEQKTGTFAKQEGSEQAAEQESRPPFSSLSGSMLNAAQASFKTEVVEKQTSRVSFSASTNTTMPNQMPGSVASQLESGMQGRSQIPSAAQLPGGGARTPPKKMSVGQKKPLESQGTSPSPASKKQKVSGAYHDQSIEQLNDVTAVSGVNLREEEEQLLSAPKEESRASEATRKVVREEEEKLILQKGPLHRKIAQLMAKCGVKNISNDVERCLSLSVEERLRGLISSMIRISRQRVDLEKARHQIVVTSDVRRQILMMSKKAKEDWERKQAEEAEKLRKQNEGEGNGGSDGDKEKDEAARSKSTKSKEEDDKMRTTAANVAARAAVGGDDMLSKWQLMAEQARQKREGVSTVAAAATVARKPLLSKSSKDHQEGAKKSSVSSSGGMRKYGRMVAQPKVVRSISAKDVIAVLEREPQMNKSPLIYKLYHGTPVRFSDNSTRG